MRESACAASRALHEKNSVAIAVAAFLGQSLTVEYNAPPTACVAAGFVVGTLAATVATGAENLGLPLADAPALRAKHVLFTGQQNIA